MIAERGRYDMTDKERRAFMRKFIDSGELRIRSDRTNTLEKMIADQMEWKFIFLEKLFIYNTLPRQFPIQLSLFWKIFFSRMPPPPARPKMARKPSVIKVFRLGYNFRIFEKWLFFRLERETYKSFYIFWDFFCIP